MGRTAEALARAEQKRIGDDSGLGRLPSPDGKWSDWFGVARDYRLQIDAEALLHSNAPVAPGMSEEIVAYYERSSIKSEQYRALRTRLISANPRQEHRIFAISSAVPREGKSVTTANLAFSIAEIPHMKTLIVDGDFRQSRLANMLNLTPSPGLADHLQGRATLDELVQPTPLPNLNFIAAGHTGGRSATELLSRNACRSAFQRFQREYHYTIIDTPPASTVSDVGVIGQFSNGVIFVVRMNRTPEPLARRAIKHILSNNVPIIGGLVIGEDDPASGYGRQYGYYRYYKDDES